ncbi:MAG: competence/damage-inducible protein A [Acutalibacteraceae bacterium]|nr:competence/damage-inducible protein A [Clostridiales bacterium]
MNCEILNVGTELLLGDILNTNAQFLSQELAKLGIGVQYVNTVGDNKDRLKRSITNALEHSDMVITTGGLGPTADDITKEVCSEVFGLELELHQESLENMKAYFNRFNHPMPLTNEKQAYIPKGAIVFKNKFGTAPGCVIEKDKKLIIMLPGPPRELVPMFNDHVNPFLQKFSNSIIVSHRVRTFGIGESALAEKVSNLLDNSNPTVAPYAKDGEALLRVTAKAETKEEAEKMITPIIDNLYSQFGSLIYGVDYENIEQKLVELLAQKNMTISIAESCTGGYTSKRITDISGASGVFECGIISYSNRIKNQVLNVSEDILKKYSAISGPVAVEMAKGALNLSGASIAIGITGIAGPNSDETGSPVGLSFIALTDGKSAWVKKLEIGRNGQRDYNRYVTGSHAFNMARMYLEGQIDELGLERIDF